MLRGGFICPLIFVLFFLFCRMLGFPVLFFFFPLYLPVAKRCLPLPSFLPFSLPSHLDEATLDHVYIKAPFLQSILGSCFSMYKLRSLTFSGGSYKSILFASALFSLSCSFCQAVLAYCGDLRKEYEWLLWIWCFSFLPTVILKSEYSVVCTYVEDMICV